MKYKVVLLLLLTVFIIQKKTFTQKGREATILILNLNLRKRRTILGKTRKFSNILSSTSRATRISMAKSFHSLQAIIAKYDVSIKE